MPYAFCHKSDRRKSHLENGVNNGGERTAHCDVAETKYIQAPTVDLAHHLTKIITALLEINFVDMAFTFELFRSLK